MKTSYQCLPCIMNQVLRVADMTGASDNSSLYSGTLHLLGDLDLPNKTTPEVVGDLYQEIAAHTGNDDPYLEIRTYYNDLLSGMSEAFGADIEKSDDPFAQAVKYAVLGNIIDFSPGHDYKIDDMMHWFQETDRLPFEIDHREKLRNDLLGSRRLLYIGDNCGEICLDKLLIKKIKQLNPDIHIDFGVRGRPIVNDSIAADAYQVGIDQYARVISNGDSSQGTVLERTSAEFKAAYEAADLVISKGQGNYEGLSEQHGQNIYYLLMAKCHVIADDIGVAVNSLVCLNNL